MARKPSKGWWNEGLAEKRLWKNATFYFLGVLTTMLVASLWGDVLGVNRWLRHLLSPEMTADIQCMKLPVRQEVRALMAGRQNAGARATGPELVGWISGLSTLTVDEKEYLSALEGFSAELVANTGVQCHLVIRNRSSRTFQKLRIRAHGQQAFRRRLNEQIWSDVSGLTPGQFSDLPFPFPAQDKREYLIYFADLTSPNHTVTIGTDDDFYEFDILKSMLKPWDHSVVRL